jgi:ABC-type nitrate/sulfonate/bicarbonate transport system substrate-binding protein
MRLLELLQRISFTRKQHASHVARVVILASLTLGFCLLPSANANASESGLDTVNLQLKWRHANQFAGYYATKEKGFYRDADLEVKLLVHQSAQSPIDVMLSGEAQYAVTGSDIVIRRAQGEPVVALAAVFQHNLYGFLVLKASGITRIQDMAGNVSLFS